MKNYFAPEMKVITFLPTETVAANTNDSTEVGGAGSPQFNDGEFGAW